MRTTIWIGVVFYLHSLAPNSAIIGTVMWVLFIPNFLLDIRDLLQTHDTDK